MTSHALLEAADQALYCAKPQGRNRLALASSIAQRPTPSSQEPQESACH